MPETTTRLRYLELIDQFTRHLINLELRAVNPAAQMLVNENWPEDEPTTIYLSSEDDARLQAVCVVTETLGARNCGTLEQVSNLMGVSSHRTATRLRRTVEAAQAANRS